MIVLLGNLFLVIIMIIICSYKDVRAKNIWKRLREKYADERRKILTYVPSGSGSKENRSDWTYYNSMQFVQKCVDHIQ